jgi:flavin-dependent dehydrogenase
LIEFARDAGVVVRQPVRVESLSWDGPALRVRDLVTNEVETVRATAVLLADGKAALLPLRPRATTDLGVKAHFAGVAGPRDAVELFGVRGHYVGVAPVESELSNVAYSVPAERVRRFGNDFDGLWRQLLTENATLDERFRGAARVGDWLASPLPRFAVVRDWPAGVIPVGNAAAALEPIGGEGIGLALRSAELAVEALRAADVGGRGVDVGALRRQFEGLWRARRVACRVVAKLLSRPRLAGAAMELAGAIEPLARVALRLMGKG